jgi:Zn ribbon nucleic-acid-binding protein
MEHFFCACCGEQDFMKFQFTDLDKQNMTFECQVCGHSNSNTEKEDE